MPWREVSTVSSRREFVQLARTEAVSMSELCRRFEISRKTGYKWLGRDAAGEAMSDRSRRPQHSPARLVPACEAAIVALRHAHPAWGARKLQQRLTVLRAPWVPAASTVHAVLARHGLIDPAASQPAYRSFEHAEPNDLWQMDFKGHFALRAGRCHALTVLDDHSRYNLVLAACPDERSETVRTHLQRAFEHYGLPWRMTMDNGPPWGGAEARHALTGLTIWLIRLGIGVSHSRPFHPQTQGKDERFHRTLKAEVLQGRTFSDCTEAQHGFDGWRPIYNHERPHESLAMQVPAQRYRPSPRAYPAYLPPLEYGPDDIVRKVQAQGWISFRGRNVRLPAALRGQSVALRVTTTDGCYEVYFSHQKLAEVDLRITNPA